MMLSLFLVHQSILPTRLGDTREFTFRGKRPETYSANTSFSDKPSGPAAQGTPVIGSDGKFGFPVGLYNQSSFSQAVLLTILSF